MIFPMGFELDPELLASALAVMFAAGLGLGGIAAGLASLLRR